MISWHKKEYLYHAMLTSTRINGLDALRAHVISLKQSMRGKTGSFVLQDNLSSKIQLIIEERRPSWEQ